jgi:hypothetical protein
VCVRGLRAWGLIGAIALVAACSSSAKKSEPTTTIEPTNVASTTTVASTTNHVGATIALPAATGGFTPPLHITLVKLIDPAIAQSHPAGKRLVAVQFRIVGDGTTTASQGNPNYNTELVDSAGTQYIASLEQIATCSNFPGPTANLTEVKLAPGAAATGCVIFEVPAQAHVATVTYTPNMPDLRGLSAQETEAVTARWRVG